MIMSVIVHLPLYKKVLPDLYHEEAICHERYQLIKKIKNTLLASFISKHFRIETLMGSLYVHLKCVFGWINMYIDEL